MPDADAATVRDPVLERLASGYPAYLELLREFVCDPLGEHRPAARPRRAARGGVGGGAPARGRRVEVEVWDTPGHPAVFARWDGAVAPSTGGGSGRRPLTALVYGHLDVQPPDPLDAWRTPPFELTEVDGRLYGRGVSDDKASMLIPILVAEAFFASGERPPVNLRFLFEAEEEVGSPNLAPLVAARAEELACDVVLSADGGMWRADLPTLVIGARGMTTLELTVRGAAKDLHSGRHGGGVANPLHAVAELIASLHDGGRVAVEGFYDGAQAPDPATLAALEALPFDERAYLEEVGAPAAVGEEGYTTLARQWYRPTLEVNGLYGGYQGPGSKTVLPSEAHAKLSCRLVPGQDPHAVAAKVRRHLESHRPPGVSLEIRGPGAGAEAYRVAPDHWAVRAAADTLAEVFGKQPALVGMGGSIPITATFRRALAADTVFFSFSTGDEDIHAPNEFYRPERFRLGLQAWARLWRRLAAVGSP